MPSAALERASTDEIRHVLRRELQTYYGVHLDIVQLARRPLPYRTGCALDELDVQLEDGTLLRLVIKDLSPDALPHSVRDVKPAFLLDPLREVAVYRDILPALRLGTAACYGSVVEPERGRYWLLLERVAGRPLWEIGNFAVWQAAARWLAALHTGTDGMEISTANTHLLRFGAHYYRTWLDRAREFAQQGSAETRAAELERLATCYDAVVDQLIKLPTSLVHGEFYASNVLVERAAGNPRLCVVDWEMAAFGPGLLDLAALIAGNWPEDSKVALAVSYHRALIAAQPTHELADRARFLQALRCCRIHVAMQWLGWSRSWTPPAEHTFDWLGEALWLARELEPAP